MSANHIQNKRDSISQKLCELEGKMHRLEYLLEQFAEVNTAFVDKTVSLDKSFGEQIQKIVKTEVFAMKAMLEGISNQNRLSHIEGELIEIGILKQSVLDKNKARDETDAKLIEERFLEEGI